MSVPTRPSARTLPPRFTLPLAIALAALILPMGIGLDAAHAEGSGQGAADAQSLRDAILADGRASGTASGTCNATYLVGGFPGHIARFFGDIEYSWTASASSGLSATLSRYRIRKVGATGGNSANIDLGMDVKDTRTGATWDYGWVKSPNAMFQDGQWRSYTATHRAPIANWTTDLQALTTVRFTFDRNTSNDPECRVTRWFTKP